MSANLSFLKLPVRWAEAECHRQDLKPTPENRRLVLGSCLYLIRFTGLQLAEFADHVAQSGILTIQEAHDIFLYFTATNKPQIPFNCQLRKGLPQKHCRRFQSCAYRSNQWRYRGRCDSVQFSIDRRIFIAGFGLYGSSNGPCEYHARIELKRSGKVIAQNNTKIFSDGSSSTFPALFGSPVQVEPDIFYTAGVILDGGELSFFGQEGIAEVTLGNITFSFQSSADSTNGTGVQGGQIPDLIFY